MEIGLGTAQFGLDYGVSNTRGKVPAGEVGRILDVAHSRGVRVLDTATAYGESEQVLGRHLNDGEFRVVTKCAPLPEDCADPAGEVAASLNDSLGRLGLSQLYGFMLHRSRDLFREDGCGVCAELMAMKERGAVSKIGVSVYDSGEIDAVLEKFAIDIIQLPLNIFDQRLIASGCLDRLKERGVEIHARSVFLQGLALMRPDKTPAYFSEVRYKLAGYRVRLGELGLSAVQGALAFVRGVPQVDVVVLGVENARQLEANISDFEIAGKFADVDWSEFAIDDPRFVNPANWKVQAGTT